VTEPTDRPRPTPDGSGGANGATDRSIEVIEAHSIGDAAPVADPSPSPSTPPSVPPSKRPAPSPSPNRVSRSQPAGGGGTRVEVQPAQVVAAAGSAIVSAARVGRLLGRTGWHMARQLPGARTLEREAQRLQNVALSEARRLLQIPQALPGRGNRPASPEEQRTIEYIRNADAGAAPLRSAMSELLERSVEATRTDSREYLYGTIISQLVPDEARILSALADGTHFAAIDVELKQRRGKNRVLLKNASAVGRQAGLVAPDNTPTYLTRLHGFGLVEFGPEDESLAVQYDILATDSTVQDARNKVEPRRRGAVRLLRKTLHLSGFGKQFWTAADPSRPALPSS
jgi:Abortive infection alpha